jgi:hypothetical protein
MNNNEWQPIETAPKDGTQIVLIIKRPYTSSDGGTEYEQSFVISRFCNYDKMWLEINYGKNWEDIPTHWMPLPKPPEQN